LRHHTHTHSHGHGRTHSHAAGADAPAAERERRILWALALTCSFMLVEVAGGLWSGSLALLADAGHMFTDVGALALAHAGLRMGRRPADQKRSYGYRRLEVLAAFVNGITLLALALWIMIEAGARLARPIDILSGPMLAVGLAGLAANLGSFAILKGGARGDLNLSGALAHVVGDMLGSIGAIVAALVIRATGWTPIDPLLSVLVAILILRSGWDIIRRSGHILLEGTPEDLDSAAVKASIEGIAGVAGAHHLHLWSLSSGRLLATIHLRLVPGADAATVLRRVKRHLLAEIGIEHSTVQIDPDEDCADTIADAAADDPRH
jgi:cobalt-zinc-cadmium efflux system protein